MKTSAASSLDDVIVVNGTHMSDEVSARILQSLSQKSVYHTTNNIGSNLSGNGVAVYRNIQSTTHRPSHASINVCILIIGRFIFDNERKAHFD